MHMTIPFQWFQNIACMCCADVRPEKATTLPKLGAAGVQNQGCRALGSMCANHAENQTRAGAAGAAEAVVAAMQAHAGEGDGDGALFLSSMPFSHVRAYLWSLCSMRRANPIFRPWHS